MPTKRLPGCMITALPSAPPPAQFYFINPLCHRCHLIVNLPFPCLLNKGEHYFLAPNTVPAPLD